MCGIVGYTGANSAGEVLIEGLKKLEYRGYDSAGVALQQEGRLFVTKAAGSVNRLEEMLDARQGSETVGIGHTRWATHGRPTDENAHPHGSCDGEFVVVHNGIIENYRPLRRWLIEDRGHTFRSETDSEVFAHLIEEYYEGDLLETVRMVTGKVEGSYAVVALSAHEPGLLACARRDSPLVVGLGEGENFVASDIPALLAHTRKTYILEDGEFAAVTPLEVRFSNREGEELKKEVFEVTWDIEAAEKGGFEHFMLKEIMEQPQSVRETLRQRIDPSGPRVVLPELDLPLQELADLEKIHVIACGTAYHAGYLGKALIENLAGIPVEVEFASEFRYRNPLLTDNQLAVVISQSGETADTLAGLRLVKARGIKVLAITNVVGSTVSREADRIMFTWAGPEIAVASTKAYITQLVALYLLAIYLGQIRGTLSPERSAKLVGELQSLPEKIKLILGDDNIRHLRSFCRHLAGWDSAFFVGRNLDYPVAMEGALKLKEISYIQAEAYAAGELKHGPLALIVEGVPVIALVTQRSVLDKTLSNIQEVKARGGAVFAITQEGFDDVQRQADSVFFLPPVDDLLAPVLSVVPTQLIAYYTALERNCPIDKPRNLAKSVTVE